MRICTLLKLAVALVAIADPCAARNRKPRPWPIGNYCAGYKELAIWTRWQIVIANDTEYNSDCGRGCLDNVRGRCGPVTFWECERNEEGRGHFKFLTNSFCTTDDMMEAIYACTKDEQDTDCTVES
ncbi:hypothetical protein PFICI_11461 [Pestalotiopsis fici W106-1]|uniref:Uncharacterized protein n=1 Tax=Pestalotiopsis fici (strain W106-1 / CGMCC3.15140) TaxID=1229662 RepID=W3WQJ3_PESFW|nr:uncharacterized protein PFICI_11461 [Pestalotiopsis fici W106-1]ETS76074.1 hypothetical protein PFICI_11461 [Pestalotiopsis fici W106-1]